MVNHMSRHDMPGGKEGESNDSLGPPLNVGDAMHVSDCDFSGADECAEGTDSCHSDATCVDMEGSYYCVCNEGFTGSGTSCMRTHSIQISGCHLLAYQQR